MASKDFWPPNAFIKHLIDRREIPRHRSVQVEGPFEITPLDLTVLQLNVSAFTPFVVDTRLSAHKVINGEIIDQLLQELHRYLRTSESSFVVLVVGGKLQGIGGDMVRRFGDRAVAVIDAPVIEKVVGAEENRIAWARLADRLVSFLGRHALSPYLPRRVAVGGRFFGRVDVLNRTTTGRMGGNFTIMGNRRIGKTSLLREIKRRLLRDNDRLRTADINGLTCHSTTDVIKVMMTHLRPDIKAKDPDYRDFVQSLPAEIAYVPEVRGEDVAVFIDELDSILKFDQEQEFELLHLLRATFEHDRCRVFFAGFRHVMEAQKDIDTPLFNFTRGVPLTGLSQTETYDMIISPMLRLGIDIPSDLAAAILQETGGHPELVQMFGAKIIDWYVEKSKVPDVNGLLKAMTEDDQFRQAVYSTFLKNTNNIEKIVCYSLFRDAKVQGKSLKGFEFTQATFDKLLRKEGITLSRNELETLTQNLKVGGVLASARGAAGTYRFAVPRLAQYCIADDLDWAIGKEKEEMATQPEAIHLRMEPEAESSNEA